jgi:adenylate cyclase class IV
MSKVKFERESNSKVTLNRYAKFRCNDPESVINLMSKMKSDKLNEVNQDDWLFKIYSGVSDDYTKRIKIRYENGIPKCAYVYDRANETKESEFQYYILSSTETLDLLLQSGLRFVKVSKTRQRWKKDNTLFHLDFIDGIGSVFEIEVLGSSQNLDFSIFEEYLGEELIGSNEDFVK